MQTDPFCSDGPCSKRFLLHHKTSLEKIFKATLICAKIDDIANTSSMHFAMLVCVLVTLYLNPAL